MNTQYFINKFEAIPEEKWCTYSVDNRMGQKCANGHCGVYGQTMRFGDLIISRQLVISEESTALQRVLSPLEVPIIEGKELEYDMTSEERGYSTKAALINNGECPKYQQETPKQRILAALNDVLLLEEQDKAVQQTSRLLEADHLIEQATALW